MNTVFDKYQHIHKEFVTLNEDFDRVDTEEEWMQLKERNTILLEEMQDLHQEI